MMALTSAERKRRQRARVRDDLKKLETPCLFCGEEEVEWHHVNADKKDGLVNSFTNYKRMVEETKKCWCLCRECHTKLHNRLVDPLPHLWEGY